MDLAPERIAALRYVTQFRCIAERCEDTCCSGLKVLLTRQNASRLQQLMSGDAEARRDFARKIREFPFITNDEVVADFATRGDGSCSFFDSDRLCSLIKEYGEPAIPDCCALYPRKLTRVSDTVEVTATLACPEAARLCLLADDGLDWVPAPSSIASRYPVSSKATDGADERLLKSIRSAGARVLAEAEPSLGAKLSLLLQVATRIEASIGQGTEPSANGPEASEAVLADVLSRALSPDAREQWRNELPPAHPAENALRPTLLWILATETKGNPRFRQLWSDISARYHGEVAHRRAPAEDASSASVGELYKMMEDRRHRLHGLAGERVERYFRNFSMADWFNAPPTRSENLVQRVLQLILKVATVRFLFYGHPAVCLVLDGKHSEPGLSAEPCAQLDRAAVEVAQIFCKYVDSDREVLQRLVHLLELNPDLFGKNDLERAVTLAQVC